MFDGQGWPGGRLWFRRLQLLDEGNLVRRQQAAKRTLLNLGITFNVYGDGSGTERIFPFDIIPRIIAGEEWQRIERGLKQRVQALNLVIAGWQDRLRRSVNELPADALAGIHTDLAAVTAPPARGREFRHQFLTRTGFKGVQMLGARLRNET